MKCLLNKLFRRKKSVESQLEKAGLTEKEVISFGTISFDVEVDDSLKEKLGIIDSIEGLTKKRGPRQLTGAEILTYVADVITILQALDVIRRKVGSKVIVKVKTNTGGSKAMTVDKAIKYYIDRIKGNK